MERQKKESIGRKACISAIACIAVLYSFIMFIVFGWHWFNANKLYNLGEEHRENGMWDYSYTNEGSELDGLGLVYYHCAVQYD